MLLFEYKRDNQEVIVEDEPTLNTEQKTFQVKVSVLSQTPKWAGYPEYATMSGKYDLALLQVLKKGSRLAVSGFYNTPQSPQADGQLSVSRGSIKPMKNLSLDVLQPLSLMCVEAAVPGTSGLSLLTDRVIQWRDELLDRGQWLEPLIKRFLCAKPEYFAVSTEQQAGIDDPWAHLSNLIGELNLDNPARAGYPWVAPQGLIDSVVGADTRQALYDYAEQEGREVIKARPRPELGSIGLVK
jgi:hypothetical protein